MPEAYQVKSSEMTLGPYIRSNTEDEIYKLNGEVPVMVMLWETYDICQ